MSASELEDLQRQSGLVGEDAAVFSFEEQSLKSWGAFLAVLGTVLTALYYLWLNPDTGYGENASSFSARYNFLRGSLQHFAVQQASVSALQRNPLHIFGFSVRSDVVERVLNMIRRWVLRS